MERYLIDTNAVSDYLSASLPEAGLAFMDALIDGIPTISIITQIEILCWKAEDAVEQSVRDFTGDSIILAINPEVIERCVRIRRNKKIKTPDAIIAATAMAYGFHLVTNNEKDFIGIEDLTIINPVKMI